MARIDTDDGTVVGVVTQVTAHDGAGGAPAAAPVAVESAAVGDAERLPDGGLNTAHRDVPTTTRAWGTRSRWPQWTIRLPSLP